MSSGTFTYFFNGRQRRLTTPVTVTTDKSTIETVALWDTGATQTCISEDVANKLGMTPLASKRAITPASDKPVSLDVYQASVELPNGIKMSALEVLGANIGVQGLGVLIGMDVISNGRFEIDSGQARTRFTFELK